MLVLNANKDWFTSNLKKFWSDCFTTRVMETASRTNSAAAQASWYSFWTVVETVWSTVINGYLIPHSNFDTNFLISSALTINLTTYDNNDPQVRFAMAVPLAAWEVLNWMLMRFTSATLNWTGVTGTLKLRLKKMDTSWTLSQVGEITKTISATETLFSLRVPGTTPQTASAGDIAIVEIEIIRATGTHNTTNYISCQFTGWFSTTQNWMMFIY